MLVAIPSYLRADNVIAAAFIMGGPYEKKTKIFVYDEEVQAYRANFPKRMVVGCGAPCGLSKKRDIIMDYAEARGINRVFMIDDDLSFFCREPDSVKLKKLDVAGCAKLLDLLFEKLEIYAHVGVSARVGNNRVAEPFVEVARMVSAIGFDIKTMRKTGTTFGDFRIMADFHAVLALLEAGYPNWVSYQYAHNQPASGSPGGCSAYRTFEVMQEGALRLVKAHPSFVKLKGKKTKGAWGNVGKTRTDVVISWKKAFASSGAGSQKGNILSYLKGE